MISRLVRGPWSLLLLGVLYLVGLWGMSVPLTGDQKVYLSIALEMKEKGSLIIPFLFQKANFLKPPFQYWMTLLGWKVFGLSLFGALIPSVLALVGSAFLIKKLSGSNSYFSAIAFAGTLGAMTYGTTAQMEIWILLFYLFAWSLWLDGRMFAAFLTAGVMAWIKGPLYPVLWVLSVFLHSTLLHDFKAKFINPKFFCALAVGIVVGISWYFLASQQYQKEMFDVFFGRENFGKLQTPQGSALGLWAEFCFSLFPLVFYFIFGFFTADFRTRWRQGQSFWIGFGLIPAIFFTFFPYRVGTYLFLITPLVVWITDASFERLPRFTKVAIGLITALISVCASFILLRLSAGRWIGLEIAVPLVLCFGIWTYSHFKANRMGIVLASLLIVNLVRVSAVQIGEWDLKGLREASEQNQDLAYYIESDHEDIWHEFGLISSALGIDIARKKNIAEITPFLAQGGILILSDEQVALSQTLQCEPWVRLKRRLKFPFRELIESGLEIDSSKLHRVFQLCHSGKTARQ